MDADRPPRDSSIGLDIEVPLRVACVDMGSNAIRFLAAEFSSESDYELFERKVKLRYFGEEQAMEA